MKQPIFKGSGVAIVTPFIHESVDLAAMGRLLDFQLEGGTDAIIVCGTTGEASTMTYRERMRTIEFCVEHIDGRIPVIAGTGSNCTNTAIEMSKEAEEAAARAKDAELLAAQGEGDGANGTPGAAGGSGAAVDPDAGETLADPNWRDEPVEPGDQDPNAPFRTPAEHADRSDMPTQAEVNAEIDREDDMDSSADAPDPDKRD